jgi:hypothetical protein
MSRNIQKSAKLEAEINRAIDGVHNYLLRLNNSKNLFKDSINTSIEELRINTAALIDKPDLNMSVLLVKDLVGSASWISNNYLNIIKTAAGKNVIYDIEDQTHKKIIDAVSRNIRLNEREFNSKQIFNCIYNELLYSHFNPKYKTPLEFPKIFPTIVLVSGVLNEIYKTAAFERGVNHLSNELKFKYFVAKTHGLKSSNHNIKLIEKQIFEYSLKNPDEKYWFVAFSKGGLDTLHFLSKNSEWCSRNVVGLSTIASPVLGSKHLNHRLLKTINQIHKFEKTPIYKLVFQNRDLLGREFQKSLDWNFQFNWFRENYHTLPKSIFYSALGLESAWYESHVYMIVTKLFFKSFEKNDGIVDLENAFYPDYFPSFNLGIIRGHHLIGARSSSYSQEALIGAHIIFLKYLNLV